MFLEIWDKIVTVVLSLFILSIIAILVIILGILSTYLGYPLWLGISACAVIAVGLITVYILEHFEVKLYFFIGSVLAVILAFALPATWNIIIPIIILVAEIVFVIYTICILHHSKRSQCNLVQNKKG